MSKIKSLDPQEALPILNGRLHFDANMDTQTVTVNFTKANTDQSVPHNLNRTNVKYIVGGQSVAGHVVTGKTSPTAKNLYLQFTSIGKVTLILF